MQGVSWGQGMTGGSATTQQMSGAAAQNAAAAAAAAIQQPTAAAAAGMMAAAAAYPMQQFQVSCPDWCYAFFKGFSCLIANLYFLLTCRLSDNCCECRLIFQFVFLSFGSEVLKYSKVHICDEKEVSTKKKS